MSGRRSWVMAGVLLLAALVAGCGSGHSVGASGDYPTDASKADFCGTFTLSGSVDPRETAKKLANVGTPDNITSEQRNGFVVLVKHLGDLPRHPKDSDLTAMVRKLAPQDGQQLQSFLGYMNQECGVLPTDSQS
jgi:hypothetical protein